MDISKEVALIKPYVIELRRKLHQIPEPALKEFKTAAFIRTELQNMGIPFQAVETGTIATIGHKTPVIGLRADIDGLRISEQNKLSYASIHPDFMHACGHDGHSAILLGAASILKKYEDSLAGTVKLIFQPAEENSSGARLLLDTGFLNDISEIYGLHIFSDLPLGHISIEEGPRMAQTDWFSIQIHGVSGHAAKPHLCADATVAAASLVLNLQSIVSRQSDPLSSAVVSIGEFHSGTQNNIISAEAVLNGTVRSFDSKESEKIHRNIALMAEHTALMYHCTFTFDYSLSSHPPVINDTKTTKKAKEAASCVLSLECGEKLVSVPKLMLGEDFASYQTKIPGTFAFLGGGCEETNCIYPNHHARFNFDERALLTGTKLMVAFALAGFSVL